MNTTAFVDRFEELQDALADLSGYLRGQIEAGEVYVMPTRQVDEAPNSVPIDDIITDRKALVRVVCDAITNVYLEKGQHPKASVRLPGHVSVRNFDHARFDAVNEAKQAFKAIFLSIPRGSRSSVRQRIGPLRSVSLMQAYREVRYLKQTPKKIAFTWAGHTTSSRRFNRDQTLAFMEKSRPVPPEGYLQSDWDLVISSICERIKSAGTDAEFTVRNPIAPHPRMMLHYSDVGYHNDMWPANLPIFYPAGEELPKIKPLKHYDGTKRCERSDRHTLTPIVESIGLYRIDRAFVR